MIIVIECEESQSDTVEDIFGITLRWGLQELYKLCLILEIAGNLVLVFYRALVLSVIMAATHSPPVEYSKALVFQNLM